MTSLNWLMIALYFALLIALTWWSVARSRNMIFLVTVAVLIGVSYATPAPGDAQLAGLTYATVTLEQQRTTRASWNRWDVISSGIVLVLIAAADLYFNG